MTKRERFQLFLDNKPVDRVPVAFFHHFIPFGDFGKGLLDDAVFEKNIQGHRLARQLFDPDIAKIMNDSLFFMPLDVSFVEKASDLRKVEPVSMQSPFVRRSLELTKRVREIYDGPDAPPVFITSCSPTFVLRNSLSVNGMPNVGGDETRIKGFVEEDPEALSVAVQSLAQGIAEFNRLLITEAGVDGIYLSVNNQAGFFREDVFRTCIAPHEKAVLDSANQLSGMNLLHICGMAGRANDLSLFTDFQAAAYNWAVHAEGVSLTEGKKLFGGKAVFGGFQQTGPIYRGSREELEQAAWTILEESGQLGIGLGADCTVPADIDDGRLAWVQEAAAKYANR